MIEKVSDYLDQKFIKKDGQKISNTNKNYCSALRMFLYHSDHIGYSHLKDISDPIVLKYLLSIPGRSNRCTHHTAVKLMFRLHGFPNKLRYIPYPDKEEKMPIHVNKEEFLKMITVCKNNKHRAIIALMFDSGLRVSEVVDLKISDLDESNMIINVVQAKGRKDRRVKFSKVLLGILQDYMSEYNPIIYLFNGQSGAAQYSVKSCQEVVKQLTKKAGIAKNFTPHKFRHGFAMGLLENGTDIRRIQNQMGHNDPKTTEIYARMNNKVIQDIESPLEQIMRQNGNAIEQKVIASTSVTKAIIITEAKEKIQEASSDKIYNIRFNGKTYLLKAVNEKIIDAPEGARWSIGVLTEKALAWFTRKGATINEQV